MQWSADQPHGGFTRAKPARSPNADGTFGYADVNVADQDHDPHSLLNWIRQLARVRRRHSEVGGAAPRLIETDQACVVGIWYRRESRILLTLHNLAESKARVSLTVPDSWPERGRIVHCSAADKPGRTVDLQSAVDMAGYEALWIEAADPPDG